MLRTLASASLLAGAAHAASEDHAARARGEKLMSDLQQTACGFNGQSFSSLTLAKPATDWTFATADKHYTWCVQFCLSSASILPCIALV